ncbi:MAG: hypothetical protein AAB944_01615, partial [Patescibacteria group bacterium]
MRLHKKGISPIGLLGEILIVLAVIIILLALVLVPQIFSLKSIVGGEISGIEGDIDKDGIPNSIEAKDGCPCTYGDAATSGCPATFEEFQKQEDRKKYNSEPVCGIVTDASQTQQATQQSTQQKPAQQKPAEQKAEPAAFRSYRSIEIFGGDDWGADPQNEVIKQACTGWVGQNCPSEDNDCDGKFNLKPLKDGCWIMASEDDDIDPNDCGQAKVDVGASVSVGSHKPLSVDLTNNYQSTTDENEPKNLFSWKWKSKADYGSLLCGEGFWYGCKEQNEGRTLDVGG